MGLQVILFYVSVVTYPTLKLDFAAEIPWLGIVYRPWRLLIIVLALPSGIGAVAIYFFRESPKFLFNSGKQEEALEVLKYIHAVNHRGTKEEFAVLYYYFIFYEPDKVAIFCLMESMCRIQE